MFEVLNDRGVIQIEGADAQRFLQSIVTNDIINNQFSYNYLLNSQGRYLFDFFVFKEHNSSFLIEIQQQEVERLIKKLSLYKLRSDVKIIDVSAEYFVIYSIERLKDSLYSERDPRYSKLGYRSLIKNRNINILGASVDNLYVTDKYKYSIPDGTIDLVYEKSIPVEYGAEELNAISYTKGCYVGQEVISRAKYQGVVRKKIYKLISSMEFVPADYGTKVTDNNGEVVGFVCSAYKNYAIAQLRREKYFGLQEKIVIIGNNEAKVAFSDWGI